MRIRAIVLIVLIIMLSLVINIDIVNVEVNAQSTNYVNHISLDNDTRTWFYNNKLVVYRFSVNGVEKVYGPNSFQTVTKSYLLDPNNRPQPPSNFTASSQTLFNNTYDDIVNNNKWYILGNKLIAPFILRAQYQSDVEYSQVAFDLRVDLETLQITYTKYDLIMNDNCWGAIIDLVLQYPDSIRVLFHKTDTCDSPDFHQQYIGTSTLTQYWYNTSTPMSQSFGANYVPTVTKIFQTMNTTLVEMEFNVCSPPDHHYETWSITSNNQSRIFTSNDYCAYGSQSDPVLSNYAQEGRVGSTIFLREYSTNKFLRCELVSASNTQNSFQNCIEVPQSLVYNRPNVIINTQLRYNVELTADANNVTPYLLFQRGNNYYKCNALIETYKYCADNDIIMDTNVPLQIISLYAERPASISSDPSLLTGLWQIKVINKTDNTTTTFTVNAMHLSNRLEINTILQLLRDDNNKEVQLIWQITYNNEVKTRTWVLHHYLPYTNSAGLANIDISNPSLSLVDVQVNFTDTSLNNTLTFVKLQGYDVFVDNEIITTIDSHLGIKFFAVEGSCYQIYKMNNSFTWLGTICAVPPYYFTIGSGSGGSGSGDILIGIYWFPQWYTTHKLYDSNNDNDYELEIIIHKTPPFKYRIKVYDSSNGNIIHEDTTEQTSNTDPLTRVLNLGDIRGKLYKLVVYGIDNNRERIVYTADLTIGNKLKWFLPFESYGINTLGILILVSLLIWTRNNAAVGAVITVVILGILNWLGLITINDTMFMLLIVIAGAAVIISRRTFG